MGGRVAEGGKRWVGGWVGCWLVGWVEWVGRERE